MFAPRTLAIALSTTLASLAAQAGIVNGSFEANAQAAGSWNIYSNLTGWTGGSAGIELRNGVAGTAQDGANYVELDTTGNSGMSQTVATLAAQTYELSLWYSPRAGVNGNSNGIEVWWDGAKLGTLNGSGQNQSNHVWRQYSFNVTGTGSNQVRFVAVGNSDGVGGSLDNISLNAVPEPGSLALVLGAVGAAALVVRRRRG